MHSMRDYFAGGKRLHFFNVAFSARATGESAWLLLGLTGMGYAMGVQGFWVVAGELLGVGGAWILLSRRFKRLTDRYDSITVPDYLESRFRDSGHWLRLIAAGTLLVFVPIYAGAQIFATGAAFNSFLGWNHFLGATVGFLVVLLYITKGGFIAVVWSDVFQGLLMVAGLVAIPIVGYLAYSGDLSITEKLRTINPALMSMTGNEAVTPLSIAGIIGLLAIGIGFWGSPQVFVRFISLKSEREIPAGTAVALTWTLLADSGAVLLGMVGRALFPLDQLGGNPENILPFMSQELLPPFIAGLVIAMVLSAIMSTIDSLLVVASSAAVRDYWQKTRHPSMPDDTLLSLCKNLTIVLALVAYAVGMGILLYDKENGIFWTIIFGWSGIAATFVPTICLSLFWSRMTALGAKCAMVTGFLCVPIFKFVMPRITLVGPYFDATEELAPSCLVSAVVAILVSLLDREGAAKIADVRQSGELSSPPPTTADDGG